MTVLKGSLSIALVCHLHYLFPFMSSRGSTPRASASLRIVEAWAGRRPSSSLLIVS